MLFNLRFLLSLSLFLFTTLTFSSLSFDSSHSSLISAASGGPNVGKYNLRVGNKYLAENKLKEGVTETASGLQYKVVKKGYGKIHPSKSDSVRVHYAGTLITGDEFDSSFKRGEPATFGVGQVIAGWTEALQLMVEGDEWELTIPSAIAYGERGSPPKIGPNAVLNFKVKLISIEGKGKVKGKKDKDAGHHDHEHGHEGHTHEL